jgi:hypothetical protein
LPGAGGDNVLPLNLDVSKAVMTAARVDQASTIDMQRFTHNAMLKDALFM